MPNVIRVTVENPDELLNASMYGTGAIIRLQSSSDNESFANEATAALVAGTYIYVLYDSDGASTTWYRTRYENAGGTTTSDWSASFQVGGEEGANLCSLYDVKQRLNKTTTDDDEELLEFIEEATADIIGYTGRRFVRSPLSGTDTFLFDVDRTTRTLWVPQGIASVTTLEVADESQPESGGTYTTVDSADWFLRPIAHERSRGWPATAIVITDNPSGSVTSFSPGYNTVRITGALGWSSVPGDIARLAERLVVRRWNARNSGQTARGGTGEDVLSRWVVTLEERRKLDWYRVRAVG